MTLVVLIVVVILVGFIVSLFIRDRQFRKHGRRIKVRLDDVRHVGTSETGAVTVRYRASWAEDGRTKLIEGRETIPAKRLRQMQVGRSVYVFYLGDGRAQLDLG
ncbi:hypothetical protein OED01_15090 [Microbacterium sp. M28]|uniref:hypothetical protein n=1 Tax=Microbacterium sp. M28 TaxID=2962064 RepID=UPI0021F3D71B|nr:hypothetical protein [Microbacterium sp. M28]UYO96907.1 hypothetical protein OED01_15090 [Microbacterium sp. M28]